MSSLAATAAVMLFAVIGLAGTASSDQSVTDLLPHGASDGISQHSVAHPHCKGRTDNPHRSSNIYGVRVHGHTECGSHTAEILYVSTTLYRWSPSGNVRYTVGRDTREVTRRRSVMSTVDGPCTNAYYEAVSHHRVYDWGTWYSGTTSRGANVTNC